MKIATTIGKIAVIKLPQQYWRVEQLKRDLKKIKKKYIEIFIKNKCTFKLNPYTYSYTERITFASKLEKFK